MRQYCRYCANCIAQDDDFAVCETLNKYLSKASARRTNTCKHFLFNEIDAFDLDKKYKPRAKAEKEEIKDEPSLFDLGGKE